MKTIPSLEPLKQSLPSIKKALVLLSGTTNIDAVSSALGLALGLQKQGVAVQVACPVDMRVEFSRLVGVDTVKKKIGNRNLLISFDYSEDQVEKVSYTISEDGKRFNLVIAPKNGALPLDPATVAFDHAGAEADATFLVGVNTYQDLGDLYEEERNVIEGSLTVALTLFPVSTYAKFHADAGGYACLSEMTATACAQLGVTLDADAASNLLFGIESLTQSLSAPTVSADTFETVAMLLRLGAKRQPVGQQGTLSPNQFPFSPAPQVTPQVHPVSGQASNNTTINDPQKMDNNPFAAALSKSANQGGTMPAGYSATGELKG